MVTVALVSAGGSVIVAITVLILSFSLRNSLGKRIEAIEADLKQEVRRR
jgi:hypothetical protein